MNGKRDERPSPVKAVEEESPLFRRAISAIQGDDILPEEAKSLEMRQDEIEGFNRAAMWEPPLRFDPSVSYRRHRVPVGRVSELRSGAATDRE